MKNQRIIFIHPCFKVYGGAENVVIDMFNWTSKKFRTRLYTLFHDKKISSISNAYAIAKDLPLSKYAGYKINIFNIPLIKKLGKKIAKECTEKDLFLLSNFPASLIFYEALKINPDLKKAFTIFLSFEPDRVLYYTEQKNLDYIPYDVANWKLSLANKLTRSWKKRDFKIIKRFVNKTITLSDYVTELTKKIYSIHNVKTDLCVYIKSKDLKRMKKEEAINKINDYFKLNIEKDNFVVLSLSRLEPSKGVLELYNIIKELNKEGEKIKLLIGGKGVLYTEIKKLSEKDNFSEVLGFIPDSLMNSFYSAGDVFVFLGKRETGGPLTILESMYCDNIVVATDDAGPKEIIDSGINGFLIDPDNIDKIKQTILQIKNMNETQKAIIKEKAKIKVIEKYNSKLFQDKLFQILRKA